MSKTIEEAAKKYAEEEAKREDYPMPCPMTEDIFKAGAKYMREYIFQIYNDCGGDMDFVKWKLNREDNE